MSKAKKWDIQYTQMVERILTDPKEILPVLFHNRGIMTKNEQDKFLQPTLSDVTIDSVAIDQTQLTKSLHRIQSAVNQKEKIIVYGDYDVDGITGTAILWETLHQLTPHVLPYIPHRVDEGYGLSKRGIENIQEQIPDLQLIITVDNGIVAHDAITFAKEKGIDVIITDHHTRGIDLPSAYSVIHTTQLCGAAVGWMFAREINKLFAKPPELKNLLDLVALATVADLVPLTGKNRSLLKNGLPFLRNTQRIGLHALFHESEIDPNKIGVYEIGHIIGPRINAMGRLESAMDSLRLLCTKDPTRAQLLAQKLGSTNKDRQLLTKARSLHAKEMVQSHLHKKILIITHETYEEGIIGLIAGKLVEEYYRPAIVIAKGETVSKASARSVAGFNIIEFIRLGKEHVLNAGGHPMAAGFTIETEKITVFQQYLESLAEEKISEELLTRILSIDCILPLPAVTQKLYHEIQQLSPFGMGNPEPIFVCHQVLVEQITLLGKEKKHLKLLLTTDDHDTRIEAIGFGLGEFNTRIGVGDHISLAFSIDENEWNGRKKLQLIIKDIHIRSHN